MVKEWGDPLFYLCWACGLYGKGRRPAFPQGLLRMKQAAAFLRKDCQTMDKKKTAGSQPSPGGKAPAGNTVAICARLAQQPAESLGLTLWDVRFVKEGASWYLRYFIDKEGGVTIDDCANLSRLLNPLLDEADPIPQSYSLEVCSPGINRELTRPEHFAAFIGWPVALKFYKPVEGQRELAGLLESCEDGRLTITLESGESRTFEKKDIASAHLIEELDFDETAAE